MIDLEGGNIIRDSKVHTILEYQVWWRVALSGLHTTLKDALADNKAELGIAPVSVAVAADTYEEMG